MRHLPSLLLCLFAVACATPPFPGPADSVVSAKDAAAAIAQADFIALGEEHQTPAVHRRHHELLRELHAQRPQLVIALEMFERDVQPVLDQYLSGEIDEAKFLAEARPWPHYARDYRPVIEFAKANGLPVLAANAPRELAKKVGKEGIAAVAGSPFVARETTAPEDAYWTAFQASMAGHEGMFGPGGMQRFYAAQCLKDDTMAEAIVDHLQKARAAGQDPLVVLICGKFHSDGGMGTVARVNSRMPGLDTRVFSVHSVDTGIYASPAGAGDFTLVVGDKDTIAAPEPKEQKAATGPAATQPAGATPAATTEKNPEGLRPALGLMPSYGGEGPGVAVDSVRDGGPAAQAGIEAGDIIIMVAGTKIDDVEHYTEVLDQQLIGKTVTVRVRRGEAEVDLQVKLTSRSR